MHNVMLWATHMSPEGGEGGVVVVVGVGDGTGGVKSPVFIRAAELPLSSSRFSSWRGAGLCSPSICGPAPLVWRAGRAGICCSPWCTLLSPGGTTEKQNAFVCENTSSSSSTGIFMQPHTHTHTEPRRSCLVKSGFHYLGAGA